MSITARLQRRLDRPGFGRSLAERALARKVSRREERNSPTRLRAGPERWEAFAQRFATSEGPSRRAVRAARVEPNAPLLIRIVRSPYALEARGPERSEHRPSRQRRPAAVRAHSVVGAIAERSLHRPRATRGEPDRLALLPRPFPNTERKAGA